MRVFLFFLALQTSACASQLVLSSSRNGPAAKTQIYLFKPNALLPNFQTGMKVNSSLDGVGISYRRGALLGFYDFEIFHTGHAFIFDREEKIKGAAQTGNFTLARGLATSGKHLKSYVLGGGGASYNVASLGRFTRTVQPIITTKIGVDWNWGFVDFGYNIPVPPLGYEYNIVTQTDAGYTTTHVEHKYSFIPVTRIGIGFTF